ncbi:hypothetical protein EGW08_010139 [Elysia chlorotica]|uniref:tRNA-5-taurinomethyluridine 2-sulfurtransferase n=1 Tax=Elysia chlorotica TaxID=188477 RepID=A0A3S1BJ74_ELYCH|nr:hypothetical protein EGW08_010139 [Elysia chlorotica]
MSTIRRIVCGISGGVDSAVSAHILKRKGYDVVGLFMRNWDVRNEKGRCQADEDREDAVYVCKHLQIPLYEVDFVKQYWNEVFSKMIRDYQNGITPNPDILCNRHVKFDHFVKYATSKLDGHAIATGHYARTSVGYNLDQIDDQKGVSLLCAEDKDKDQTFFLSQIEQWALRHTIFPLGNLSKKTVKEIAASVGMGKLAHKKESMGICFIGTRNFQDFIEEYIEPKPGNFIDIESGKVVGTHKGTHYWTLGQRCNLAGLASAYFVAQINADTQDIYVAAGTDHPALFSQTFVTSPMHWIRQNFFYAPPLEEFDAMFRFQHKHPLIECSCKLRDDGGYDVSLERPMRAVTPGQYSVILFRGRLPRQRTHPQSRAVTPSSWGQHEGQVPSRTCIVALLDLKIL